MHAAREREAGLGAAVPFRFACTRCGHCCSGGTGHVWLEESELGPLATALGMELEAFTALHVRGCADPSDGASRLALVERADGRCALLEGSSTCRAYHARPVHCRTFPHWPRVHAGGAAFEAARATCPGIAVDVDAALAAPAFERLAQLYAGLEPSSGPSELADGGPVARLDCCLEGDRADELWMSALEADYAVRHGRPGGGCRLGPARPLCCRLAGAGPEAGQRAREAVRRIEHETGHPVAYGPARALLVARGVLAEDAS
ncbi:MAG: YkgJ family cysteine cluster protein [Planctomycetes bacterium]|nr:YkgJ family cysteine cluster protein [Planctomycetota bacterium]